MWNTTKTSSGFIAFSSLNLLVCQEFQISAPLCLTLIELSPFDCITIKLGRHFPAKSNVKCFLHKHFALKTGVLSGLDYLPSPILSDLFSWFLSEIWLSPLSQHVVSLTFWIISPHIFHNFYLQVFSPSLDYLPSLFSSDLLTYFQIDLYVKCDV